MKNQLLGLFSAFFRSFFLIDTCIEKYTDISMLSRLFTASVDSFVNNRKIVHTSSHD